MLKVYKIICSVNQKPYVGQTKLSLIIRLKQHLAGARKKDDIKKGINSKLARAIRKHGPQNFKIELIEVCNSKKHLNEREIYWIDKLDAIKNGYNVISGGQGINFGPIWNRGIKLSKKYRKKISIGSQEWWNSATKEQREHHSKTISKGRMGIAPWNKGIKNCFSKKSLNKLSKSLTGRKQPNISKGRMGIAPWNKGLKKVTIDKNKISKKNSIKR